MNKTKILIFSNINFIVGFNDITCGEFNADYRTICNKYQIAVHPQVHCKYNTVTVKSETKEGEAPTQEEITKEEGELTVKGWEIDNNSIKAICSTLRSANSLTKIK